MFIFVITYQKPLDEIEKYLDMHRTYLDINYKKGYFIASGRQEPRTGGIILCKAETKELAMEIMKADPFYINKLASYNLIEFYPTKYAHGFDEFI